MTAFIELPVYPIISSYSNKFGTGSKGSWYKVALPYFNNVDLALLIYLRRSQTYQIETYFSQRYLKL